MILKPPGVHAGGFDTTGTTLLGYYLMSNIQKKDDGTVELSHELPTEALEAHREAATKHLGRNVSVPGFRAGKAPVEKLAEHIGEVAIWEEMASRAVTEAVPKLLQEHKIEAIGRPHISVTKLAPGNPLEFKLITTTLPEVTLPDYKALAQKHPESTEDFSATDQEVEENIQKLREQFAKKNAGDGKNKDTELPDFDNAFVQKLGDFKTVDDFKSKLKEQISTHKKQQELQKRRTAIIESILTETKVAVPALLVEAELGKMLHQFKSDVERIGIAWKDYLAQIKKTEEDLRTEWKTDAEKNAKTQLMLNAIAKKENIRPDSARVEHEVEHILSRHKNANKESVRVYVMSVLSNEAVLAFLEKPASSSN